MVVLVLHDQVLVEEAQGLLARCSGEPYNEGVEVVQDRVVDFFDRSVRGHDGKEGGNPVHHLAKSELVLHRAP